MAQVPYQPIPGVAPSTEGAPGVAVSAPEAAFGAGIAKGIEGAGQMLFSNAVAMQQLKNESDVNQATTNYLVKSGELDNSFRLLQGNQAQTRLPQHIQALQELRANYRSGLNPMAQKMFDRETMRRMGYDIVNASNYAATQAKQFTKQTREGSIYALQQDAAKNYNNPDIVNDSISKIIGLESSNSTDDGDPMTVTKMRVQKQLGVTIDKIAKSMARTDTDGAEKLLENYKGKIPEEMRLQTLSDVKQRGIRVNAARITSEVMGGGGELIDRAMRASGIQESGLKGYSNVTTTINPKTGKEQKALGKYGIMDFNVGPWSKEILGQEVSQEEFLKNKDIQDQIYRGKMGQYLKQFGVEGAGRAWLGGPGAVSPDASGRTDAFGTRVDDYGRRFAALVGPETVDPTQRLSTKMALVETAINKTYANEDPVLKQQALEAAQSEVLKSAAYQQKVFNDTKMDLKHDINTTMNQKNPVTKRGPISMQEAIAIDPNFENKIEQAKSMGAIDERKLGQMFMANANQDNDPTEQRTINYKKYLGMSYEEKQAYDPNEAFNKGEITNKQRLDIIGDQAKAHLQNETADRADLILNRHRAVTDKIKAFPSRTNTKANDKYIGIRGALILELQRETERGISTRKPEDEDRIMDKLISEEPTGEKHWYGGDITRPVWETLSLQYPRTISSASDFNKLKSGQVYIYNGVKAVKP